MLSVAATGGTRPSTIVVVSTGPACRMPTLQLYAITRANASCRSRSSGFR